MSKRGRIISAQQLWDTNTWKRSDSNLAIHSINERFVSCASYCLHFLALF